ncbi:MAG: hypothetical protein COA49_08205 [Bacteroidetes bacterium]|nr:MAG: hypothetical protein COA49_08205 [Bacteroidota bacterium]
MNVKVIDNQSSQTHPFLSPSWLNNCGTPYSVFEVGTTKVALSRFTSKGVKILATPPWALDCGLSPSCSKEEYKALVKSWIDRNESLKIIDLPPSGKESEISADWIKHNTPKGFRIQWKHTRQIHFSGDLDDVKLPSNREKQIRRASREGIVCTTVDSWSEVISLHQESRERKGILTNYDKLEKLLTSISSEEYCFAIEARNNDGECIASGGFIMVNRSTCLYSFGGQKRSKLSGFASVALLAHAINEARSRGASIFDFGGSSDPGVDIFYKEFGAESIPKARLIQIRWWLKPFVRFMRPDLF